VNDTTPVKSQSTKDALPQGYQLHWFELQSVLGRGGYGVTYLAVDKNLDRQVAIKEYLPVDFAARQGDQTVAPLSDDKTTMYQWGLERFLKEARTLAKFNHPNIVRVISVFEQNGTAYMVMEYEHGKDLAVIRKQKAFFTEDELLDIFIPIIDGLALVHEAGFIHRDIKPSNIYIREDNSPVLLDFGSARQSTGQTRTLTSLVTYGYAPFEQYNEGNEKQGPWTDIYSLGASMYFCITKKKPEDALRRGGCILSNTADPYQPVSLLAKDTYSKNFLLSIDHALRFHVDARPQDTITWAQMLLGNITARPLPSEFMQELPKQSDSTLPITNTTDTVIRPRFNQHSSNYGEISKPPTGERLIDSSGRRMRTNPTADNYYYEETDSPRLVPPPVKKSKTGWVVAGIFSLVIVVFAGLLLTHQLSIDQLTGSVSTIAKKVSPGTAIEINKLLSLARQDVEAGRLVQPAQNNAVYRYTQVLQLDADNRQAKQGINDVAKQFQDATQQAIKAGNVYNAELQLSYLEMVLPRSKPAIDLREQILALKAKTEDIGTLLKQAKRDLDNNRLTEPEGDSALSKYREILSLDPGNNTAKQGINTIFNHYKDAANEQLTAGKYADVKQMLAKMQMIKPDSSEVRKIEQRLKRLESNNEKIAKMLEQARNASNEGHYIEPKSASAFYYYNLVLDSEPHNTTATQGIKTIQAYYKREFDKALSGNQLDQAQQILTALKVVETNSAIISKAERDLQARKVPARPDMEVINELIGQFKTALEHRDKSTLNRICEFTAGRVQYLEDFYSNYKSMEVAVTDFVYIPKAHKATANIQFDQLINSLGKREPSGAWAKFKIVLKRNKSSQWKVFW